MHTKVVSKGFKLQIHVTLYSMADKITAKDLAENKGDFVVIDVREADEITKMVVPTIEGVVNIPLVH